MNTPTIESILADNQAGLKEFEGADAMLAAEQTKQKPVAQLPTATDNAASGTLAGVSQTAAYDPTPRGNDVPAASLGTLRCSLKQAIPRQVKAAAKALENYDSQLVTP